MLLIILWVKQTVNLPIGAVLSTVIVNVVAIGADFGSLNLELSTPGAAVFNGTPGTGAIVFKEPALTPVSTTLGIQTGDGLQRKTTTSIVNQTTFGLRQQLAGTPTGTEIYDIYYEVLYPEGVQVV